MSSMWSSFRQLTNLLPRLQRTCITPSSSGVIRNTDSPGCEVESTVMPSVELLAQKRSFSSFASPSSLFRHENDRLHGGPIWSSLANGNPILNGCLLLIPTRGMKIKGIVKRRCKDCTLIWENGVLFNRCKTHPRHTQKLKEKYWANQRILTHATSGFKRPW